MLRFSQKSTIELNAMKEKDKYLYLFLENLLVGHILLTLFLALNDQLTPVLSFKYLFKDSEH
jgi:hypothetical protein